MSWVKKERDEDFDVPMGCYDSAEVFEILGSYILNLLGNVLDKDLASLYRDDGLAIVRNLSSPETERKRKAIIKISPRLERVTTYRGFFTDRVEFTPGRISPRGEI